MTEASSAYQQMRMALAQWADIPDPQWDELASIFRIKTVPDKKYILLPGDATYDLVFVFKGLLRIFYMAEDGKESNKAFAAEGMFAGPLATALLKLPSRYGIQALEPTTLLAASYADYFGLLDRNPAFDRLGRKTVEWVLGQRELREQSLLQKTATERYVDFVAQHPDLVERVPQYHIASYLGITEVSLSRLKRTLAEEDSPTNAS